MCEALINVPAPQMPEAICAEELDCLIDLHLHLDGSLSLASVRELAALQDIQIPESDAELLNLLTVSGECRDLNEYLEKFAFPGTLLQTREGLAAAVCNLKRELYEQGVIYAEIRLAPQKHCAGGLTQDEAVQAAIEGMERCDLMKTNLILCCMRGEDNHAANVETMDVAVRYFGRGVCAADLAGAEAMFKTRNFADLFAYAREKGLRYIIHAGEADGPESVWQALQFGAERIGHGVRSVEDPELVKELAQKGIALEMCPTSNLNTAIFDNLQEYPLLSLLNSGVRVTVNTDNMSVSSTTLRKEYRNLIDALALTRQQVRTLLLNSANAAFADDETKAELTDAIEHSPVFALA